MPSLEARVVRLEKGGGFDRKRLARMSFMELLKRVNLLHTQWFVNGSLLPRERMELAAVLRRLLPGLRRAGARRRRGARNRRT